MKTIVMTKREKLLQDLNNIATDTESLLEEMGHEISAETTDFTNLGKEKLANLRKQWQEIEKNTRMQAEKVKEAGEKYVHENPWTTVGYAFGAGVLAGAALTLIVNHPPR